MTAAPEVDGPAVKTSGTGATLDASPPRLRAVSDPWTLHHHEWEIREALDPESGRTEAAFLCRLCGLPHY